MVQRDKNVKTVHVGHLPSALLPASGERGDRPVPRRDSRPRRASSEGRRGTGMGHGHRSLRKVDPSLLRKLSPLFNLPRLLKQLPVRRSSENQLK